MSQAIGARWETMKTERSSSVELALRQSFPQTDVYEYNSASIRVRVIDPQFSGMSPEDRDALVEPLLDRLPEDLQRRIVNLLTLPPSEAERSLRERLANAEFEDPSQSLL